MFFGLASRHAKVIVHTVNGGHLRREHRLELILRLYAFNYREKKIAPELIDLLTERCGIGELV
jgi:hypothetical protein